MLLLSVEVTIKYKSDSIDDQVYRSNIIIYNDPVPIITSASIAGQTIITKLQNDYPESTYYAGATQLYKSDLLSLRGELQYNNLNNVGSFGTYADQSDSIFNYMPNLQQLHIWTCSGITWTGDADKLINLAKMPKLEEIFIEASSFTSGTTVELHLSNSTYLTQISLSGTNNDVVLNTLPNLTTLVLGNPKIIEIVNCPSLVLENCSCQSAERINGLSGRFVIENNSNSNSYAFALFDKFYNLEY